MISFNLWLKPPVPCNLAIKKLPSFYIEVGQELEFMSVSQGHAGGRWPSKSLSLGLFTPDPNTMFTSRAMLADVNVSVSWILPVTGSSLSLILSNNSDCWTVEAEAAAICNPLVALPARAARVGLLSYKPASKGRLHMVNGYLKAHMQLLLPHLA